MTSKKVFDYIVTVLLAQTAAHNPPTRSQAPTSNVQPHGTHPERKDTDV